MSVNFVPSVWESCYDGIYHFGIGLFWNQLEADWKYKYRLYRELICLHSG